RPERLLPHRGSHRAGGAERAAARHHLRDLRPDRRPPQARPRAQRGDRRGDPPAHGLLRQGGRLPALCAVAGRVRRREGPRAPRAPRFEDGRELIMSNVDQVEANNFIKASLAQASYVATVSPVKLRLMDAAGTTPTASVNGTEISGGSYVPGGQSLTAVL